jgi:hypothetical protein
MRSYSLMLQGISADDEAEAPRASDMSQPQPHVSEYPSPAQATHANLHALRVPIAISSGYSSSPFHLLHVLLLAYFFPFLPHGL